LTVLLCVIILVVHRISVPLYAFPHFEVKTLPPVPCGTNSSFRRHATPVIAANFNRTASPNSAPYRPSLGPLPFFRSNPATTSPPHLAPLPVPHGSSHLDENFPPTLCTTRVLCLPASASNITLTLRDFKQPPPHSTTNVPVRIGPSSLVARKSPSFSRPSAGQTSHPLRVLVFTESVRGVRLLLRSESSTPVASPPAYTPTRRPYYPTPSCCSGHVRNSNLIPPRWPHPLRPRQFRQFVFPGAPGSQGNFTPPYHAVNTAPILCGPLPTTRPTPFVLPPSPLFFYR